MEQLSFFEVPSPCVGICTVDEKGYCKGCMRKREERFNWLNLTNERKLQVIEQCRQRYLRKIRSGKHYKDNDEQTFEAQNDDLFSQLKDIVDQGKVEIDSDVREELDKTIFQGKSAANLSDKALDTILWLLKNFFLPFFVSCIATVYMEQSDFVRELFSKASTSREIKSEVRKQTFGNTQKNLRVIIGDNLNFREGPAKKHNTLGLLNIGDVVEVIDSTHNSWLYVRVVIDDEVLTGWIYRRYTKKLNYMVN